MVVARCIHERGEAEAVLQVDARAPLQQLPHHLQVIVGCGGVQQGFGYGLTVIICRTADWVDSEQNATAFL